MTTSLQRLRTTTVFALTLHVALMSASCGTAQQQPNQAQYIAVGSSVGEARLLRASRHVFALANDIYRIALRESHNRVFGAAAEFLDTSEEFVDAVRASRYAEAQELYPSLEEAAYLVDRAADNTEDDELQDKTQDALNHVYEIGELLGE